MRLPLVPTLMVAAMAPVMIGLGFWQLQRAAWKETLLAELAAAPALPVVDLDRAMPKTAINFRRAVATCTAGSSMPTPVAGRNRAGKSGYSYRVPCTRHVAVNAGWSPRPDAAGAIELGGRVAGLVVEQPAGAGVRYMLYADSARPPLEPSAPPSADTIPNNHMGYAVQWFLFAGTLLVIYFVHVRRLLKR